MKLYISNLSPKVNNEQLHKLLSQYGIVLSLNLDWKQVAGRMIGNATAEMPNSQATIAIAALNGKALCHRRLYLAAIEDAPVDPILAAEEKPHEKIARKAHA